MSAVLPLTGATSQRQVQLAELSPKHRQVAALLAQGVDRATIATICDYTPEYVTWLCGDPSFRAYLKEMLSVADARLEALFESSVDAIAETLVAGSSEEKLKAARLQMEATRRIGPRADTDPGAPPALDRLEKLAERLTGLLRSHRGPVTLDGSALRNAQEDA